jgi:D-3-phosphoglycerate dehydrogenase
MSYKILALDNVHEAGVDILHRQDGFEVDVKPTLDPLDLKTILPNYDAMIIRSGTKLKTDLLDAASKLKVVVRAGAGVDNIDIAEATRRGVIVMNTPGGNSQATAEHTISLIMSAHRHIAQAVQSMKDGKWEKKKFQGRELQGRTLGVIGLGQVGGIVAKLASQGLKMKVLGYDPAVTAKAASQIGAEYATIDSIFARSDVITVHTPLNDHTKNLINAEAFQKMKDGVIIINCARGGIVDQEALLQVLESRKVAAAGLDVYTEQPPGSSPLVQHPNVIATPHLGASTGEAQVNVSVAAAEQIIDYLDLGVIRNAVNVPAVGPSDMVKLAPYLDLATRLAQFLGGLGPTQASEIKEMEIQYVGDISSWNLAPITNSALVGLLSRFADDVNLVNAHTMAEDRGIKISETTLKKSEDLASSIQINTYYADGTSRSVIGSVLRSVGNKPRILGVDNFSTEAVPAGSMLVITNRDKPGMIAGFAGILAAKGINIAQMNLSRESLGGTALSIINIDEPADEDTLKEIRNINGVLSIKQVTLDD